MQLNAGVRLLAAQVHIDINPFTNTRELRLCHSVCTLFDGGANVELGLTGAAMAECESNEWITLLLVKINAITAR